MAQAVKRACDACHRRKVKCDGINPCRNCSSAQLSCTYNAIPQKKGPKGSRAKVISELRETQRQTSLSAKVQNRMNGIACPPNGSSLAPTPGLLTGEMVKECVVFFFDNLYTQLPILDRRTVEQQILYMEQNRDAYCLMASLCAFVMLQPGMTLPSGDPYSLEMVPGANIISSQLLVEETLRVRKGYEYLDSITVNALATNFFLFACHYSQEMHDKAWYHLREATTMIHMAGMNKEDHFLQFDTTESSRRRRLYWLFYTIERAYAIQRQRPLTLQATITRPTVGDDPSDPLAHQLNSFILLVDMYRPFDDAFTAVWNKARSHLSQQYVTGLQKQLNDLVQSYSSQNASFHDVRTNQSWLKNTVWQLSNGATNPGGEEGISFQYPMDMSRELLMNLASQFPGQGMELMNSGLIEKLIETAYSMTEFLSLQPASRDPFAVGPGEHLDQILNIAALARNGDYRFLPLLLNKVNDILPRLVNPMLQNAPENPNMANVDIFDGFGNAGMAQPPQQMQLRMDNEYNRKYSGLEDSKYGLDVHSNRSESGSSGNHSHQSPPMPQQQQQQQQQPPQTQSEMGSSFVSSPGIVSPAAEYPHNMNTFACNPVAEMVMSPLATQQQNPMNNAMAHPQQSQQQQQTHQHQHPHSQHQMMSENMHQFIHRPHPTQRQGSFHVPNASHQGQMRPVGHYHGLPDSMAAEIDFASLR